jgi:hypothetical protein
LLPVSGVVRRKHRISLKMPASEVVSLLGSARVTELNGRSAEVSMESPRSTATLARVLSEQYVKQIAKCKGIQLSTVTTVLYITEHASIDCG